MKHELRVKKKIQKRNLISYLLSLVSRPAGFTLIELLVVFTTLGLLSVIGVASFVSYSKTQAITQATFDVVTTINLAKSRARTQIKPTDGVCIQEVFQGYQIRVLQDEPKTKYQIAAICGSGSEYILSTQNLTNAPTPNIKFATDSLGKTFLFKALSGSVDIGISSNKDSIDIIGFGKCKKIYIYTNGKIETKDGLVSSGGDICNEIPD